MTDREAQLSTRKIKRRVGDRYAAGEARPLGAYAMSMSAFFATVGMLVRMTSQRGGPAREVAGRDLALGSVAVFRASRLLASASVTSPLRAPFTRYAGPAGAGEVREEVQDPHGGTRHAIGELVSCPYCLGTWMATAFGFGLLLAPGWTRLAASILAMEAGADVMQKLYSDLQSR